MKSKFNIAIMTLACFAAAVGCKTESDTARDTQAPGPLSNVTFTPLNGGGYFKYTIPDDEDYLYARAEYSTDSGEIVSKTSSVYADSLVIEGLGSVKEYDVRLFAVDRYANESEPVAMTITPLEPSVNASLSSLDIYAGFSSVVVTLENPREMPIDIYVSLKGNGSEALKVFTSNKAEDRIFIQGLEAVPYEVSAYIEDNYGNRTESKSFGSITPLTDYKLDKSSFSFLRDQLLYGDRWDYSESAWEKQKPKEEWQALYTQDSMKNARESRFEGHITKFWDDMTDDDASYSLNYFHSGTSYPFSYFIDLGREVQVSRMRLFMRNGNKWGTYTVRTCEIWISNDKTPEDGILDDWEYVGTYTINKPASDSEAALEFKEGSEFWMYPESPAFTRPFRYLRYKAVKDWNNGSIGCMSEITLYGQDVK